MLRMTAYRSGNVDRYNFVSLLPRVGDKKYLADLLSQCA